jgi:hypothetical protein
MTAVGPQAGCVAKPSVSIEEPLSRNASNQPSGIKGHSIRAKAIQNEKSQTDKSISKERGPANARTRSFAS